ncbi:MAG TPA: hypothetical protein VIG68_01300, partial [Lysobacter sp.]
MSVRFDDARWFPVDLDVVHGRFAFLPIDADVLERSVFLDTRIEARLTDATVVDADALPAGDPPPPGWLFHTSFCCSTLLARALHLPPALVALKEPLVLRRLADAREAGQDTDALLPQTVALLARPWQPRGAVVIKPTHAALNIAGDCLDATPGSRAVVLSSGLEDFLVSNIKKTPETQAKIPALAERALKAGTLAARLGPGAFAPPDLLCAA